MDERAPLPVSADVRPYGGPGRRMCLVTAVRPHQGLSSRLAQFLSAEMPSIGFTLTPRSDVRSVWICGYEGDAESIACLERWRTRFPDALVLVTGRGPTQNWAPVATETGADFCQVWPTTYGRVEFLLGGRPAGLVPRPVAFDGASASEARSA